MTTPDAWNAPSPPSLAGRTLEGKYRILDVIGSGGMATVYRARDTRLGRVVALKILHPQLADDPQFAERFRHEAEFAAGLSGHPNIVSILDVGQDGGLRYIVMEYVDGRNLKELIQDEGPFTYVRTVAIGRQIASALDFAHRHGLVHRDVKPQNILVARDGQVKVTDFGIARGPEATQLTRTGVVLGTVAYLSPEQALGEPATAESDVYSLGVVLFEMMTGRLPFESDSSMGVAMQHVHTPPPSPSHINPAIPPGIDAVVLRALSKNPAERYPGVAELAAALEAAGEGPTVAGPLRDETAAGDVGATSGRTSGRTSRLLLPLLLGAVVAGSGFLAVQHFGGAAGTPTPTATGVSMPAGAGVPPEYQPTATPGPTTAPAPVPIPTATRVETTPVPTATEATAPTSVPTPPSANPIQSPTPQGIANPTTTPAPLPILTAVKGGRATIPPAGADGAGGEQQGKGNGADDAEQQEHGRE